MDKNKIIDFLNLFPNYCVYAMREDKNSKAPKGKIFPLTDNIEDDIDEVIDYNSGATPQKKYGIFFTPNGHFALADCDRKSANAKYINAIIMDVDTESEEEKQEKLEMILHGWFKPSVVVETKRGYHVYYLLKEPVEYRKTNKDKFKKIEEFIIENFGADEKAKDISRILRVPGFRYWKDNKGEYEIKIIHWKPKIRYTLNNFVDYIKEVEQYNIINDDIYQTIKSGLKGEKKYEADRENFFNNINDLPVNEVLEDLYPEFKCLNNGSIKENGKLTDGYKWNKRENYLNCFSPHDERPVGKAYHIAKKKFGGNIKEIVNYFETRWGIKLEYKNEYSITGKYVLSKKSSQEVEYKNKIEDIVKRIFEGEEVNDEFVLQIQDVEFLFDFKNLNIKARKLITKKEMPREEFVSGGIILPIQKKIINGKTGVLTMLYKGKGYYDVVIINTFDRLVNWRNIISKGGLTIQNKDQYFTGISYYILNYGGVKDDIKVIEYIGLHNINGEKRIITVEDDRQFNYREKYFVYLKDAIKTLNIVIHKNSNDSVFDIKEAVKEIKEIYDPTVTLPLFLWLILAYNISILQEKKLSNTIVFLVGETQTGKTTLLKTLLNAFGLYYNIAAASTPHAQLTALGFYGPVWFSEYRFSENKKEASRFEELLRNTFDLSPATKGTASQRLISYGMNAKLFIDGQSKFQDEATVNRMFFLLTSEEKKKKGNLEKLLKISKGKYGFLKFFTIDSNKFLDLIFKWKNSFIGKGYDDRSIIHYSQLFALAEYIGILDNENEKILHLAVLEDRKFKRGKDYIVGFKTLLNDLKSRFTKLQVYFWDDMLAFESANTVLGQNLYGILQIFSRQNYRGNEREYDETVLYLPIEDLLKTRPLRRAFFMWLVSNPQKALAQLFSGYGDEESKKRNIRALLMAYEEDTVKQKKSYGMTLEELTHYIENYFDGLDFLKFYEDMNVANDEILFDKNKDDNTQVG